MLRNVALIFFILLALSVIIAWNTLPGQTDQVAILPKDCRLMVGEQMSLTLEGLSSTDVPVRWKVTSGAIISVLPGWKALFLAPAQPALVTVSASIPSGIPGQEMQVNQQCIITSRDSAPRGLAQATGTDTFGTLPVSWQPYPAAD